VSRAHLNPVVSCADVLIRGLRLSELAGYVAA
jgi:glycerol uptake facilitator-like aquaporin